MRNICCIFPPVCGIMQHIYILHPSLAEKWYSRNASSRGLMEIKGAEMTLLNMAGLTRSRSNSKQFGVSDFATHWWFPAGHNSSSGKGTAGTRKPGKQHVIQIFWGGHGGVLLPLTLFLATHGETAMPIFPGLPCAHSHACWWFGTARSIKFASKR